MKIINLSEGTGIYTSNVYLLTGEWNAIADINTLIDTGRDPFIIPKIEDASTGVGKNRVAQVILTHSHYDHAALLPEIVKKYNPVVYACDPNVEFVNVVLKGGEMIRAADKTLEVICTPGHSTDSICLYCMEDKAIFAGDSPLIINTRNNTYEKAFVNALEYISRKEINTIYFGHGKAIEKDCNEILAKSLENIKSL